MSTIEARVSQNPTAIIQEAGLWLTKKYTPGTHRLFISLSFESIGSEPPTSLIVTVRSLRGGWTNFKTIDVATLAGLGKVQVFEILERALMTIIENQNKPAAPQSELPEVV